MNKIEELIIKSAKNADTEEAQAAFVGIAKEFIATLDEDSVNKVIDIENTRQKNNWKPGSLFYKCKEEGLEDCLASLQEIGLEIPSTELFEMVPSKRSKPELKTKKTEYKVIYGTAEEVNYQVTSLLELEGWRIWGPPLPYGASLAQTLVKEEKVYSWAGIDYPYSNQFKSLYDQLDNLSEGEIAYELERHLKPLRVTKGLSAAVVELDEQSS